MNAHDDNTDGDRASYMVGMPELMGPSTIMQEKMASGVVGVNAPCGGPHPTTYTIGTRGQEDTAA